MRVITLNDIRTILNADLEAYARNKRTGGDNNDKGGRFENQYATNRIAELASECIAIEDDGTHVVLNAQVVGFVDDLAVCLGSAHTYSQIKDVQRLDWKGGTHSLEDDFRHQETVCNALNISPTLEMVVSRADVGAALSATIPAGLDVAVVYQAPHDHSYYDLPQEVRDWLSSLVRPWDDPSNIENSRKYLLTAWLTRSGPTSLANLLKEAVKLSACVMRPLGPDFVLSDSLAEILTGCEDLEYWVRGVNFSCEGAGFLAHAKFECGSDAWYEFEERIINSQPRPTALEVALMVLRG